LEVKGFNFKPDWKQLIKRIMKNNRLQSIYALRGFDMFWIMGRAGIVLSLANYTVAVPYLI